MITDIVQTDYNDRISLSWSGKIKNGETIIIFLRKPNEAPLICLLDDIQISWEKRGDRILIELPDLGEGEHRLEILLYKDGFRLKPEGSWYIQLNSTNRLEINHVFVEPVTLNISIYDLSGRLIYSRGGFKTAIGYQKIYADVPMLPSGSFIVRIFDGREYIHKKLLVLR